VFCTSIRGNHYSASQWQETVSSGHPLVADSPMS
jgi:hypothetical protein